MMLQEQNEGLHQHLLKTSVRMECLGDEFMNNQQHLEVELQKTRIELSNLTESYTRLQSNCSTTQLPNNILQQNLHAMGTSAHHFQSDDAINQGVLPITPPPTQFMDSNNCGKAKASGQEQPLTSVPEEGESDWSEMSEEKRFMLPGSNRDHGWRHVEGEGDKACEDEEVVRLRPACSLQTPHLQFIIHNETLQVCQTNGSPAYLKNPSDCLTGQNPHTTAGLTIGSTILIRSASLEEIPLACHHLQKELRMDLHHPGDVEAVEDSDNEIIHHWTASGGKDAVMRRLVESEMSEADRRLTSMQSDEQMLNHFICERQPSQEHSHDWAGGLSDEELKVESTQL
ncbi:uncharacterized protein LOC143014332 [Genypterus blacodes]|uniref:uncharacterized protein LOC143014332 n=1 Tax=Genypterus blacodes TaxID=154954 RepID=UPI003F76C80A